MIPDKAERARERAMNMRPFQEMISLKEFKMFMACECVGALEVYLEKCINDEFYEGAAYIRDLLNERRGKVEVMSSTRLPIYF